MELLVTTESVMLQRKRTVSEGEPPIVLRDFQLRNFPMAVLTYLVSAFARISAPAAAPARARPGLLARFVDRLIAYRSQQALEDMQRHGWDR